MLKNIFTFGILFIVFMMSTSSVFAKKVYYYDDYERFEKVIRVNTFANKLSYYEKGVKIGEMDISSGDFENATPRGRFKITNKHPLMYSQSAGKFMPYWMEFYQGIYGLHALPQDHSGALDTTSIIGQPASAGCVRLDIKEAKKLYDWADYHTVVLVDYNKTEFASVQDDTQVIQDYFQSINSQKYEEAYMLRLIKSYSLSTFTQIYTGVRIDIESISQRNGSEYSVKARVYKNDRFLFSSTSVFQVTNGKIVRSYVLHRSYK